MGVNVKKVRKGVDAQKTWGYDNMDSKREGVGV